MQHSARMCSDAMSESAGSEVRGAGRPSSWSRQLIGEGKVVQRRQNMTAACGHLV